jgi:molecular chaperone Hsp33
MSATAAPDTNSDTCLPFEVEGADVRGQAVRLHTAVDEVLNKHDYPGPVSVLLGEMLCLAVMLGASLKFEGRLSLQTKSDGPVSMLVADFSSPGSLRAYARFDPERVAKALEENSGKKLTVNELLGKGQFTLVIDQGADTEIYQGIVALEGDSISQCAETYFKQSEQIATSIKVAVSEVIDPRGQSWSAGGIMIQHLPKPDEGRVEREETPAEIWNRVSMLLATTQDHELTDPSLSSEQLLFRLFHEDGIRVFGHKPVQAGCSCGEKKVEAMLKGFGTDDIDHMVVDGVIEVTCEFCNSQYSFNPEDL